MRVDWSELILLTDFPRLASTLLFPTTTSKCHQLTVPSDGPVTYYMAKNSVNTVDLEIIQPGANIEKATI
jgi:hypothetical protein